MKVSELKALLKPLIKEAIKETLLEEGILSTVIQEVMRGVGANNQRVVSESLIPRKLDANTILQSPHGVDVRKNQPRPQLQEQLINQKNELKNDKAKEARKRMLDAIGGSYGGVDLFEGTAPLGTAGKVGDDTPAAQSAQSPLAGVAPDDPGVDLSIFGIGKKQ